eukprot:COSAG06_NODE_455_length_15521_cov_8.312022_21_plen_222_part_00
MYSSQASSTYFKRMYTALKANAIDLAVTVSLSTTSSLFQSSVRQPKGFVRGLSWLIIENDFLPLIDDALYLCSFSIDLNQGPRGKPTEAIDELILSEHDLLGAVKAVALLLSLKLDRSVDEPFELSLINCAIPVRVGFAKQLIELGVCDIDVHVVKKTEGLLFVQLSVSICVALAEYARLQREREVGPIERLLCLVVSVSHIVRADHIVNLTENLRARMER